MTKPATLTSYPAIPECPDLARDGLFPTPKFCAPTQLRWNRANAASLVCTRGTSPCRDAYSFSSQSGTLQGIPKQTGTHDRVQTIQTRSTCQDPGSVMEEYGGCWLVQRGLVAQSSASKRFEGVIRALRETLRALGVTLELKTQFGA